MDATATLLEFLLPALMTTSAADTGASSTRAPTHAVVRADDDGPRTIEIEIIERGTSKKQRTRLTLPDNGKLEAFVSGGDDRRECRVRTEHGREAGVFEVHLQCRGGGDDIMVEARPRLRPGKASRIASIERADGRIVEVEVTAR